MGEKERSYSIRKEIHFLLCGLFKQEKTIYLYWIMVLFASVLLPLLNVFLPTVTLKAIEENAEVSSLMWSVGGIAVLVALCSFIRSRMESGFVEKIDNYRMSYLTKLENVNMTCDYTKLDDPAFHVAVSQIANLIFNGNTHVGIVGLGTALRDISINLVGVLAFAAIIFALDPWIVLLIIITAMADAWINAKATAYASDHRNDWAPIDKRIEYMNDTLTRASAAKDIRLYDSSPWLLQKLERLIVERVVWLKRVILRRFGAAVGNMVLRLLRDGVAIGWVVYMVVNGNLALYQFSLYLGSVTQLSGCVAVVLRCIGDIQKAADDMGVIQHFFEKYPPAEEEYLAQGTGDVADKQPVSIRFENVCFGYAGSETNVLENINITIDPGEKIALVGANGAGKTTLIKLLCGFYTPTGGTIYVGDKPIDGYDKEIYRDMLSVVFQDTLILPFSVNQNVAMTREEKVDAKRVRLCLEKANIGERFPDGNVLLIKAANDNAEQLSGGEEQRLLLARALYKDAPILLLDEPTAALDPVAESKIYESYYSLVEKKTSIFISHRLASTRFCDRILYLDGGRVAEEGSHKQLLAAGKGYAQMFEIQSQYYRDAEQERGMA